jgi:zinc protease
MFSNPLSPLSYAFDNAANEKNADICTIFPLRILAQNVLAKADLSQPKVARALDLPQCVLLSNGMTIYFQERKEINARQPFACLRLVVRTGHISEDFALAEQQTAHLVEHGLFQGTESFSSEDIKKLMEEIKCPFGADGNAHTDFHETVYKFNNIPLAEGDSFKKGLHLFFEFACKATFPPEAMLKERAVVEDELLKREGFNWEHYQFSFNKLRAGSGLAEHLVNAFDPKIQNCEGKELHQHLMNFYKKWYQPHNMALIVVGDFRNQAAEVFQSIQELFNKIPTAKAQGIEEHRLKKAYPVPPKDKILYACFTHSQLTQSSVEISTPISDEKRRTPNRHERERFIFQELIHHLCLKIFKSRLNPLLALPDNPLTGHCFSSFPRLDGKFTNFNTWGVTANHGKLAEAFKSFISHLFTIYKNGVTESELIAVKKQADSDLHFDRSFYPTQANQDLIERYVTPFSGENVLVPYLANWSNQIYYLKKVSLTEVDEVLKDKWNLFTPEIQNTISMLMHHPQDRQPVSLVADVKEYFEKILVEGPIQETIPLRYDLDWLPARPPVCAPSRTQYIKQIGCTELQFKNGIRVFLKPVDEESPAILLKMICPYGFKNTQSRSDLVALKVGLALLEHLGLADRTKQDIRTSLQAKPLLTNDNLIRATFTHCEFQQGCTSIEGLELALQLLYSRLENLQPIYSDEFKNIGLTYIKNSIDYQTQLFTTANKMFSTELSKLVVGEHPALKDWEPHDFASLTVEQCQDALKKCFQNLSRSSLVVCGNFKCDEVIPLVNSYIGALSTSPIKDREKQWQWPSLPFPTESKETILYQGYVKDRSRTSLLIPMASISNEKDRYLLQKSALILSQYLEDTIRFEEQLIYSINCSLAASDPSLNSTPLCCSFLLITFVSSFSSHDRIHERILEILKKAPEQPPKKFLESADVIREKRKKEFELNNQSTKAWFSDLCEYLQMGSDPVFIAEERNWERALTNDELYRIFCERIFTNPTLIKLTMHPK